MEDLTKEDMSYCIQELKDLTSQASKVAEHFILRTPTGETRNKLTEINTQVLLAERLIGELYARLN